MKTKAFYPAGLENIWHKSADGTRTYRLDGLEKIIRLREALAASNDIEIVNVDIADTQPLSSVHTAEYLEALRTGQPAELAGSSGIMWQPSLLQADANSVQCLLSACHEALQNKFAISLGKGGHHAVADRGYGFGSVNEVAIVIRELQRINPGLRIAVIDLDVHMGNGWQELLADKTNVLLVDLWSKTIPKWGVPAAADNVHSRFVGVPAEYLEVLNAELNGIRDFAPKLMIYHCGLDVLETDRMSGIVGFTEDVLWQRERLMTEFVHSNSIPTVFISGGGYVDHAAEAKAQASMSHLVDLLHRIIASYAES